MELILTTIVLEITISVVPASYLLVNINDSFQSENHKGNFSPQMMIIKTNLIEFYMYVKIQFDNHFTFPK